MQATQNHSIWMHSSTRYTDPWPPLPSGCHNPFYGVHDRLSHCIQLQIQDIPFRTKAQCRSRQRLWNQMSREPLFLLGHGTYRQTHSVDCNVSLGYDVFHPLIRHSDRQGANYLPSVPVTVWLRYFPNMPRQQVPANLTTKCHSTLKINAFIHTAFPTTQSSVSSITSNVAQSSAN